MIQNFEALLRAANLPVVAADDSGSVTFSRALSDAEQDAYLQIIAPAVYARLVRQRGAPAVLLQSPLAKMTADQAEAWIAQNVTDLPSAKTALRHLARMVVALRDLVRAELAE